MRKEALVAVVGVMAGAAFWLGVIPARCGAG
jgi:hypothetical protein